MDNGEPAEAEERLQSLLGDQSEPRFVKARQDTYFRLAQIALAKREPLLAIERCNAGLPLGTDTDLFTANLYILRGNVRASLNQNLAAAEDYPAPLRINGALLKGILPP